MIYYFVSLKDDGQQIHIKHAMYVGKTQQLRSKGFGHWTKEEFRRKFEKKPRGCFKGTL